ncbi:hypothetical protein HMI54_010036 [Coelomomyces lativittatus]|nr:hypothetical protein HMI56_004556 [Coelomomyces lativittatus]KAJ1501367.1 hypothetical protein HMI54_010036 [Coelomomyces lativittatus]KAJ1510015.1 hypothetical protein HMI55_007163 [Coelomomyces lativittatus]
MLSSIHLKNVYLFCLMSLMLVSPALSHMNLIVPVPRTHKNNPFTTDQTVDYDIMAPLDGVKKPFACAGTKRGPSVLTVNPGEMMVVQIEGGAPHNGGHCEFSISYDGISFVSLKTIIRECLRATGYKFGVPLPSTIPGGSAIFSWTWVNAEGNREFYQNCADITINGPASGTLTGPPIVVADLPGFPTIPEMTQGVDDRRSLYMNRRNITISPTMSGTVQVQGSTTEQNVISTPTPTQAPSFDTITSFTPPSTTTESTNALDTSSSYETTGNDNNNSTDNNGKTNECHNRRNADGCICIHTNSESKQGGKKRRKKSKN